MVAEDVDASLWGVWAKAVVLVLVTPAMATAAVVRANPAVRWENNPEEDGPDPTSLVPLIKWVLQLTQ